MSRTTLRVLGSHALASTAMSLVWPLLLLRVFDEYGDGLVLGAAAGARMLPYVVLSWWVARLADRHRRDLIVRVTLIARLGLLTATMLALATDHAVLGVVLATLAIAAATPAYPALAAGMPRLAGAHSERATDLLVTIEVAGWVVGPAIGGLLLGVPWLVGPVSVVLSLGAVAAYAGVRQPRPAPGRPAAPPSGHRGPNRALGGPLGSPLRRALAVLMLVNLVDSAVAVGVLPLAKAEWGGDGAYGPAVAALGFSALGGPLLSLLARGPVSRARLGFLLVAGGLGLVVVSGSVWWALAPLALVGASTVVVESAATAAIQEYADDDRRAGLLGLADTAMVAAALVGSVLAPPLADAIGAVPAIGSFAAVAVLPLLGVLVASRPRLRALHLPHQRRAGDVPSRGDVREPAES